MQNEEITKVITSWLEKQKIDFRCKENVGNFVADLYLPTYRLAMFVYPEHKEEIVLCFVPLEFHYFFIDDKETENDVILRLQESLRIIKLNRVLRYTWRHMTKKQKRKYRGIWPLNFGKFKNAFIKVLAKEENDYEKAMNFFIEDTPKEKML